MSPTKSLGYGPLAQAVLEVLQVLWRAVGGHHNLAAELVQGVKGVEELLFGVGLALEELDVVDEEHICSPKVGFKALDAIGVESRDELIREALAGAQAHDGRGCVSYQKGCDRVQQVCLPDSGRPAYEQRVEALAGSLGDR